MKRALTITALFTVTIFFFSNFENREINNFVFSELTEEPTLPPVPFDYSSVVIPEHLSSPEPDDDIGYGSTGIPAGTTLNIEDDKATLGRVLFYDEKLSALENISCGSCHLQELSFTDDVSFSEGVNSLTKRNSMNLNDLFWSNRDHFFWDMSEHSLFEMIRLPLKDENEIGANLDDVIVKLGNTTYYDELFRKAFGSTTVTEDKIVDALVHFISSMVTFESEFDKAAVRDFVDFNDQQALGLELFSTNCSSCHSQGSHNPFKEFDINIDFNDPNISPLDFFPEIFNNGLPIDPDDEGAGAISPFFKDLFKIPTLRNVEVTGPYMHDGRFTTLREVIDHYSDNIQANKWTEHGFVPIGGFGFTETEKDALEAFMKTLTDDNLLTHTKWSDPFSPSVSAQYLPFEELVVAPNPMSDFATINFENTSQMRTSIRVLSMSGQLLRSDQVTGSSYTLDKGDFTQGTYVVEITQGDKRSTQKLIVK